VSDLLVEELISSEDADSSVAAAETDSAERRTLEAMSERDSMRWLQSSASTPISSSCAIGARAVRSPAAATPMTSPSLCRGSRMRALKARFQNH
jgi:hypothetical protein